MTDKPKPVHKTIRIEAGVFARLNDYGHDAGFWKATYSELISHLLDAASGKKEEEK